MPVGFAEVHRRRDAAVLEHEHGLDEAGQARHAVDQVADVALDRARGDELAAVGVSPNRVGDGADLDGIAEDRPGSVRLQVGQRLRADTGPTPGIGQQVGLGTRIRRGQHGRGAVIVDRRVEDDRADPVAVLLGLTARLQHQGHDTLTAADPRPVVVERAGAVVVGHDAGGVGERPGRGERQRVQLDTPDDRRVAVAVAQPQAGFVQGQQGRRAGRAGDERRAAQVEQERQSGRHERRDRTGHGRGGHLRQVVGVGVPCRRGVDARACAPDAPRLAGVLQAVIGDLEEAALLRVHHACLGRGDPEELRIEPVDVLDPRGVDEAGGRVRAVEHRLAQLAASPGRGLHPVLRCHEHVPEALVGGRARKLSGDADDCDLLGRAGFRPGRSTGSHSLHQPQSGRAVDVAPGEQTHDRGHQVGHSTASWPCAEESRRSWARTIARRAARASGRSVR